MLNQTRITSTTNSCQYYYKSVYSIVIIFARKCGVVVFFVTWSCLSTVQKVYFWYAGESSVSSVQACISRSSGQGQGHRNKKAYLFIVLAGDLPLIERHSYHCCRHRHYSGWPLTWKTRKSQGIPKWSGKSHGKWKKSGKLKFAFWTLNELKSWSCSFWQLVGLDFGYVHHWHSLKCNG